MTQVIKNNSEWAKARAVLNGSVGFVPTMGALHEGHLELIRKSKLENDFTVVSIFVNPTQFNNKTDFEKYPQTYDTDLAKLQTAETDYLFYPDYQELYPDSYRFKVTENEFSKRLCGEFRPGHFDGVLTVVMKLLNIINPTKAYFGEKDYQQYTLVKDMAKAFFMSVEIVGVPTVRDARGLALSSRNIRLSPAGIEQATKFANILNSKFNKEIILKNLRNENIQVEYLEEINNRRFAAVVIEGVRLIDNVQIKSNGETV